MDIKLEHTSIIDKKNQLLDSSHKGDIQLFFGIVTFAPPCCTFICGTCPRRSSVQ
jgi:hypothetical protein